MTYGTASAPYLATRCLQQLAADESKDFSLAPEALTNNFYVDDALCGANTIDDALRLEQISKGTCAQRLREHKNSPVSKRIISSIVATIF